jgi:hypothetical protein
MYTGPESPYEYHFIGGKSGGLSPMFEFMIDPSPPSGDPQQRRLTVVTALDCAPVPTQTLLAARDLQRPATITYADLISRAGPATTGSGDQISMSDAVTLTARDGGCTLGACTMPRAGVVRPVGWFTGLISTPGYRLASRDFSVAGHQQ